MSAEEENIVSTEEVKSFIKRCMLKVGSDADHADILADVLCAADYRGHYSHGLNRLDLYVEDMLAGIMEGKGNPEVLNETVSTAWVDGQNLLGAVVGKYCNELAIQKAKETGIGMVVAYNTNHFGIVGWYTMKAMEQGLIGMAFTNTSPGVFPTRASKRMLGTNPISLAAPGKEGDSFVLDMATAAVAGGKLEMAARTGTKMPYGWAVDPEGKPSQDPADVFQRNGGLMPLGGDEQSSGYKGTGLSMMVEVLCGVLGGGEVGPTHKRFRTTERKANLSHCFIVINPSCFGPGSADRLQTLMDSLRSCPPVDEDKPVLVAGDPEKEHMKHCDNIGGIPYHQNQIQFADDMAAKLGIPTMKVNRGTENGVAK